MAGKSAGDSRIPDDGIPDDHLRILQVIANIPSGCVCTYGCVAALAGLPGRARLVGRLLSTCPLADALPWHRVVNSRGRISIRECDGASVQRERLTSEGVDVSEEGELDLTTWKWCGRAQETVARR